MAAIDDAAIVTDPFLRTILDTSARALQATNSLLDLTVPDSDGDEPHLPAGYVQSEDDQNSSLPGITSAQEVLFALIAHLRGQNRRLALNLRDTKAITSRSRSEIDTLHLSLQNLYYESRHLTGEISACESYPHKYIQLPLIPEIDFLERLPQWRGRSDEEIMKARIESEYEERVELEEKRKALVTRKMDLVKWIARRKEELVKLDADLEVFIEASKPIQKTFEKEY